MNLAFPKCSAVSWLREFDECGEERLPAILHGNVINPHIPKDLIAKRRPIRFRTTEGIRASGYRAEVCEVYLKARDAGELPKK